MDALQASYRDDEDGDTSEAHTPPPHPTAVQHGGAASTPTAPAVDTSGTKPELIEYNEIDEIKTCLQTPAAEDVSSGEIPLTTTAVDVSNTKSELLKINHVGGIEEGFETADASIGEKTLYGTPQTMDNDRIGQPITAAQGGESAGNPTTTAVDISGTNPDFCVNNQVHEINEGLQTAAAGVVTSGAIPLYGTLQETESGQGGGTSSNSPATAAVDRDASFVGPNQMAQPYTLRAPNLPLKPDYSEEEAPPLKKQKHLSDLLTPKLLEPVVTEMLPPAAAKAAKKSKKKNKDVWSTTSRKGKKKTKHASNSNHNSKDPTNGDDPIDKVTIAPIPRFPDKNDDGPDINICLSKVYKAEKVELSDDRLSASSTKGYRMVRATRGVTEGAWYFEIKVVHLGETGHTRLGWSTEKADLQAPVGYDGSSFGYRDVDGSKVHKASREKYGDSEGYKEGDVIGFYINLPDGGAYAPDPQKLVWHKGQKYVCAPDAKDEIPVVPGSEISYFKNGTCQGVAFTDLYGGCYYPAASMYTMPNQPACVVKFNFGPDFEMFPEDFGERPVPRSMFEVPYQSYDGKAETGTPRSSSRPRPMLKVIKEENSKIMKASEMVD